MTVQAQANAKIIKTLATLPDASLIAKRFIDALSPRDGDVSREAQAILARIAGRCDGPAPLTAVAIGGRFLLGGNAGTPFASSTSGGQSVGWSSSGMAYAPAGARKAGARQLISNCSHKLRISLAV